MSSNISYQCPTEFNVLTQLKSCKEYKKELQESTDQLKYRFDMQIAPMCFMQNNAFQGLALLNGGRRPPRQLLDMEKTLQMMPLIEQENDYVIDDIRNAKPPSMPAILSNRLVIPDCKDIISFQRTKIKRTEFPQMSHRLDKKGMFLTNYMRIGRDTRQEMKDAFKEWEKKKNQNTGIYGVGKFDSRPLKPGTNPTCTNADSALDCMHVYGPDSVRTNAVIDPTLTLNELTNRQGVSVPTPVHSVDTLRVAQTIDPNTTFTDLLRNEQQKSGCNARFYGYTPPGC